MNDAALLKVMGPPAVESFCEWDQDRLAAIWSEMAYDEGHRGGVPNNQRPQFHGKPVSEVSREVRASVLDFLIGNPGSNISQIRGAIKANSRTTRNALDALISAGWVVSREARIPVKNPRSSVHGHKSVYLYELSEADQ